MKINKSLHIESLLNLQEPGEHTYCGPGLINETGLTYDP
jgi:hypothetical protein